MRLTPTASPGASGRVEAGIGPVPPVPLIGVKPASRKPFASRSATSTTEPADDERRGDRPEHRADVRPDGGTARCKHLHVGG